MKYNCIIIVIYGPNRKIIQLVFHGICIRTRWRKINSLGGDGEKILFDLRAI
jgi:hypothetical protein